MNNPLVPAGVKGKIPAIAAYTIREFPEIQQTWGYAASPDHNTRECVDFMTIATRTNNRGPADVKALGDRLTKFFITLHAQGRIKVKFMVWRGRAWRPIANDHGPRGWGPYKYPATHFDHVHIQFDPMVWLPPVETPFLQTYVVDPAKVHTYLYGLKWDTKTPEKKRKPGFKISTGIRIETWQNRMWLITKAGYGYAMEYLTTNANTP